jgi:chromosome segregation ATPase
MEAYMTPLETRIASAFGSGIKSAAVTALIIEAEAAAVSVGELADRARERALDPTISTADLDQARSESETAAFTRDRMKAAVVRLRHRLAELQRQEEQARRQAAYEAAKSERDQLAEELARVYPALAAQLADLAKRIRANDATITSINRKLPARAERLDGAEVTARGLHIHVRHSVPRITSQMVLPAFEFEQMKPYLWPSR